MQGDDVMTCAARAYRAWCSRHGYQHREPSDTLSGIEKVDGHEYAVLRNANGILRVYSIDKHGSLKALDEWPEALEDTPPRTVTERALIARINGKLARHNQHLRVARTRDGECENSSLGRYFILNTQNNLIDATHVNLISLGIDLRVLSPDEILVDE